MPRQSPRPGAARAGAQQSDEQFAAYMAARQPSLLRTAYLLCGDRHLAEDLVQTTFAKLYLGWAKAHEREQLDSYVRRILVNENSSLWRKPWKRRETSTDTVPERAAGTSHPDVAHAGSPSQSARPDTDLWDFVQQLPRKQRAAVVLRYYEELSEAETAAVLGVSVGTVKSQTSRALATLRSRSEEIAHLSPKEER